MKDWNVETEIKWREAYPHYCSFHWTVLGAVTSAFFIYSIHLGLVSARLMTAYPCQQASSAEFTAVKCRHASHSLNLFWDPIFYLWKPALSAGWTSLWESKLLVTWRGSQHATLITALPSAAWQERVEERVKSAFSISCNYSWPIVSDWKLTICSHLVGFGEWRGFIAFCRRSDLLFTVWRELQSLFLLLFQL